MLHLSSEQRKAGILSTYWLFRCFVTHHIRKYDFWQSNCVLFSAATYVAVRYSCYYIWQIPYLPRYAAEVQPSSKPVSFAISIKESELGLKNCVTYWSHLISITANSRTLKYSSLQSCQAQITLKRVEVC